MRPRALTTWTTAVLSALAMVLGTASSPAAAESSGYRYWSFWVQNDQGEWSYASQGPTLLRPADGKVVGFRFTLSASSEAPDSSDDGSQPRGATDFDDLCSDTARASDGKRVAVVIDPGTERDAPGGERPPKPKAICAQLPDDGSAADALAKDAPPLRYDSNGLLCAIAGYPGAGCGERTSGEGQGSSDDDGDDADGSDGDTAKGGDDSGTALPLVAGLGVVALLAAGAVWQARRRRDS